MNPLNTLAIEAIDFQKDDTGMKLELIVEEIRKELTAGTYKPKTYGNSPTAGKLIKLIKERFGIKAKINCTTVLAAVMPVYVNKNHALLYKAWRGQFSIAEQDKVIASIAEREGYVDNRTAKVSGVFSEAVVYLYFDFKELIENYKATNAEIVAIILHEVGHAFYAFEYSDRLSSVNQIIAATLQDLKADKARSNQAYIYKELKKISKTVTEQDVELITSDAKVIPGIKLASVYLKAVKSQMTTDKYDDTSFEALADNFAARFGYQEALVTGLDKFYQSFSAERSKLWYYTYNIFGNFSHVAILGMLIAGMLFPGVLILDKVIAFIAGTLFIASQNTNNQDMTYDQLKFRYKRIRNQFVEQIKNMPMAREDFQALVDSIHRVDAIIEDTNVPYNLLNKVMNIIWPPSGKSRDSIVEQQLMEELISNDLFIRSAELKHLFKG